MDRGQRFPSPVMEFDHVRGEKVADVSQLMRTGRMKRLAERPRQESNLRPPA